MAQASADPDDAPISMEPDSAGKPGDPDAAATTETPAAAEAATAEPVDTHMSTADGEARALARADFPEATAAGDAAEDVAEAHDVDEARDVQIELAQVGEAPSEFFREIS